MSNPTIIYARALDCSKSTDNVRSISDASADAELEANIGETGQIIQNLIGVAVPRKKGHFHIYGGGRRLEGVHANIAKGVLGEDFMVPVLPARNKSEAIAMSLAENYYNLRMNPADECRGFQAVIEARRKTPAEVAKQFGVTERFVLGRLRLANLAEPVFEALRLGEITLDVAIAYASTADADRQAKVFARLDGSYYADNLYEIRRQLASGSYQGGDAKALLVGREAYLAAGGCIDWDLFTDDATEVWSNGDLVDKLAETALTAAAEAIRAREGFAEVRAIPAPSLPSYETIQLSRLVGEPEPLAPEAEARRVEIDQELASIQQEVEEVGDATDEQAERIQSLREEAEAIADVPLSVSPTQKASAIAYVLLGRDGQPVIHEQLYVAPSAGPDDGEGQDEDDDAVDAEAEDGIASDAVGGSRYSQKLRDELAMMKTELLALHIANDPHFALDLGTFIMADEANRLGATGMPSSLSARAATPRIAGYTSDTQAAEAWVSLDQALDRSWLNHKEMSDRYDAFCALDDTARAAWLGWAIARTLHAVPAEQQGGEFIRHLGAKLDIDVAAWWRPTARNFFTRLTKPAILDLFETIGGHELKSRYAASRKFDLAASAEKLFSGQVIADADVKERALAWIPEPMRFGPEGAAAVDADGDDEDDGTGFAQAA